MRLRSSHGATKLARAFNYCESDVHPDGRKTNKYADVKKALYVYMCVHIYIYIYRERER